MWVSVAGKFAAAAKPAAFAACLLFAAGCAENQTTPEAKVSSGVEAGTTQDFLLNVGDRVFFNENSAELTQTSIALLDKQAAWLAKYPTYRITVEGHSDEKGDKKKNKKLSEQRAAAVEKYLVSRGVDKSRIHLASYGREKRVATCNDVSCWSQNRRVVTVLQTAPEPVAARGRQTQQQARAAAPAPAPAQAPAQRMPTFAPAPTSEPELVRNESVDMSTKGGE
jgi:peptidoglycan-associated lipoprotein